MMEILILMDLYLLVYFLVAFFIYLIKLLLILERFSIIYKKIVNAFIIVK